MTNNLDKELRLWADARTRSLDQCDCAALESSVLHAVRRARRRRRAMTAAVIAPFLLMVIPAIMPRHGPPPSSLTATPTTPGRLGNPTGDVVNTVLSTDSPPPAPHGDPEPSPKRIGATLAELIRASRNLEGLTPCLPDSPPGWVGAQGSAPLSAGAFASKAPFHPRRETRPGAPPPPPQP